MEIVPAVTLLYLPLGMYDLCVHIPFVCFCDRRHETSSAKSRRLFSSSSSRRLAKEREADMVVCKNRHS